MADKKNVQNIIEGINKREESKNDKKTRHVNGYVGTHNVSRLASVFEEKSCYGRVKRIKERLGLDVNEQGGQG